MIVFRNADSRLPFLWEGEDQPPARWHGQGEGPAQYFSDTPDGAWAELLRHEEIREPDELATIIRALWVAEIPDDEPEVRPDLPKEVMFGDTDTYASCQDESKRLRNEGATRIVAPSAALIPGEARGWKVDQGLVPASPRDGQTLVLFGRRRDVIGWHGAFEGRPGEDLLDKVHHYSLV
jgi:hypothetical protein